MASSSSSVSYGDNLSLLTKLKLTDELRKRNLKTAGTKDVLITRLKAVLKQEMEAMQVEAEEQPDPELAPVRQSPDYLETMDTLKEDEDPSLQKSGFLSSDYENIDSAQGSPEGGYGVDDTTKQGTEMSANSPRDSLEPITPQKDFEDANESLFEQIDSTSEAGEPEAQDVTYEVLSDRDSAVEYKDFDLDVGEDVEHVGMAEYMEGEDADYLPGEQLPYEGDDLLYEDEPMDPALELLDSQGEHQPADSAAESKSGQFQIEGQEPISPCDSQEEYPEVLQDSGEKSEPKIPHQSAEDSIVLDVGGENLETENVSRKDKFDKSKELKKQDPKCNLWISNLSEVTRASILKNKFSAHGNVISAKIVTKASKSGEKNKFFGYVIMSTPEEASQCIEILNNSEIDEKQVTVEIATATLPNVVSRSSRQDDRESGGSFDSGDYGLSGRREDLPNRRIVLVRGGSGQKLVRIRDPHHSGEGRIHFSPGRQVREVRDVRGHRSASPRDRRIPIDRRNRYSPPSYRGIHSADPYRRRVVSRDYPISSRGLETKNYSYRGRGDSHMRPDNTLGRGFYPPRLHHPVGGMHTGRSFESGIDKSRREEDKRRMAEEIRRHEKLEHEIRKREQREKERLLKQMHEREDERDKEFRERERQLHEREKSEREKRMILEEALRAKEKRERELLKEKEMQNLALQESERKLAKREKDAVSYSQLQEEMLIFEKKQKEEKHNLEQKLREYQTREKRFEMEQQQKIDTRERMDESVEDRRMKESRGMKRYEEVTMPRQPMKRAFDEPRRDYSEKRIREEPHSIFYPSTDSGNQRWRETEKPKASGPSSEFRNESYPSSKRGSHSQQPSHSTGHSGRYQKQPEEFFDHGDSGHQSYSHSHTRPYSSRGGHSYRGRSYAPRSSGSQRSLVHSSGHTRDRDSYDSSKKMREHSDSPPHERYYPRSDRHSLGSQSHKSQSDSRSISRSGPSSSSMSGRHSDSYSERHSSNKSIHRDNDNEGMGGDWQSRSYSSSTGQTGYSNQRPQSFEKLPRLPVPTFGIPPTPVLPGAPGGFMGSLAHPAATAALFSTLSMQQAGLRNQVPPFQPTFPPGYRQ